MNKIKILFGKRFTFVMKMLEKNGITEDVYNYCRMTSKGKYYSCDSNIDEIISKYKKICDVVKVEYKPKVMADAIYAYRDYGDGYIFEEEDFDLLTGIQHLESYGILGFYSAN